MTWGWKVTLYLYGPGDMPDTYAVEQVMDFATKILGAKGYVGIEMKPVDEEPEQQEGS